MQFQSHLKFTSILSALILASPVLADTTSQPPVSTQDADIVSRVTPDAVRPPEGPSPYQLNLLYTGEIWDNTQGGLHNGALYMQNLDGQLSIDTGRAFGWTGGKFYLEGFYAGKNSFNDRNVGAVEEQSPVDAAGLQTFRLYQAYYDQSLGSTDILFGVYDPETEFSVTKPMSLFLSKNLTWNTALDQSGTSSEGGSIGPGNYPHTPLAVRVRETLSHDWSVQAVVADAVSDNPNPALQGQNDFAFSGNYGVFGMGEVDYVPEKHTKLMAGLWALTSKLPAYGDLNADGSPRMVRGDTGGYVGGATRLYTQEGLRGLDGFFTVGLAAPDPTNTDRSVNGGLVYTGLLDSRPNDKMGVSFNVNIASAPSKVSMELAGIDALNSETSVEATYRATIFSWLTVQPDIQYITHPGYESGLKNDVVVGLHFEIGHLFDLE